MLNGTAYPVFWIDCRDKHPPAKSLEGIESDGFAFNFKRKNRFGGGLAVLGGIAVPGAWGSGVFSVDFIELRSEFLEFGQPMIGKRRGGAGGGDAAGSGHISGAEGEPGFEVVVLEALVDLGRIDFGEPGACFIESVLEEEDGGDSQPVFGGEGGSEAE